MQVGDTYTVRHYTEPKGFNFIAKIESQNPNIATVTDNVVTAIKEGSTNLVLNCGDYTETVPVHVGKQIVNTSSLKYYNREIKDIVFCNVPTKLQVGDEWAIEGIGINSTGVCWDWYYDDNALVYNSSNTHIATVEFGVVTARNPGVVTITASNMTKTVTKSLELIIEPENRWWETVSESKIYKPTAIESSFLGFQTVINDAIAGNYQKLIIPKAEYILTPTDTPIDLPSDMCIDFNGSIIKMSQDNDFILAKKPYTTFRALNKDNLVLMNGTFYGECFYKWVENNPIPHHVEHELMFDFVGGKRGRIINCEVSYAPGFSVNCSHLNNIPSQRDTRKALKLTNIEPGGINTDGTNNDAVSDTFRTKDFIPLDTLNKLYKWSLGNFQGYGGYAYMYSRLFSIWFFDISKSLIGHQKYLRQFAIYDMPKNAEFCKIEFYQSAPPTKSDPDFGGIAHLINKVYSFGFKFENCTFKRCVSTGLLAMGDMTIIDNCYFEDCGVIDPASSIDWEDYGQATHSCIVRKSTFKRIHSGAGMCALRSVNSSSLVFHDNVFDQTSIDIRSNTEWFRFYRNWVNTSVGLNSKYDSVFAGNALVQEPTIGTIEGSKSQIFMADNVVCIDSIN